VGATALTAGVSVSGAGKAAPKECPKGQARIVFDGKGICQPLGRALPSPREGDERVAILRTLLTSDWGNPPDRKGRRPPTIEALLADFGPGAAARVRKAITEIPATVDRLTKSRAASAFVGASAKAPCGPPKGAPTKTDTKTEDLGNGSTFDLHTSIGGGKATAGFGLEGNARDGSNRRVRWDVDFDLCEENLAFNVAECPTFDGKLDGAGKTSFTLKVSSLKDGALEHSATVEIKHNAKSKGTVGVDAKLDRIEIEDTYRTTLSTSRQSIFWGPSSEGGTVERSAWVDMRTGRYDLGRPNVVDVQVSYTGILSIFTQDALARARVAAKLKAESDDTFAKTVKHVVEEYRERETKWQTPNTCADMKLAPASNTLKVKTGDRGRISGEITAKRGGKPDSRWRLMAKQNLTVSPDTADVAEPAFDYRVTRGGARVRVSATFRATSKAGVARATWTQGGKDEELVPPRAWTGSVTMKGTIDRSSQKQTATSSGNVTLYQVRGRKSWQYQSKSGTITWKASGSDGYRCTWETSGSRAINKYDLFFDIAPNEKDLTKSSIGWSAADEMEVTSTETCPDGTRVGKRLVPTPFGALATLSLTGRIDPKLRSISGSKSRSYSDRYSKETFSIVWSFKAVP
jgi:hypothetical protein